MILQLFKPLWGHHGTLAEAAEQAVTAGFQGIEGPVPADPGARRDFTETLRAHGLLHIAEISATGFANPDPAATVADQLDCFERLLAQSLETSPLFCTTMAGNDLWTLRESVDFLTRAHEIAQRHHTQASFETHRSRSLFHPILTRDILRELPGIEITVDFSHWCVVTERLVMDLLPEILDLCAQRVLHIHARVGYDQGPQVPDPRAPEYANPLRAHLRWWQSLWSGRQARGCHAVTMTPEFGPDGYLHLEPHTQKPAADLWEVNQWMGHHLQKEFQAWRPQNP